MGQRRVAGVVAGALVAVLLGAGVLLATSTERQPAPTAQTEKQVGAGGLGVPEVTTPTTALGLVAGAPAPVAAVKAPPPTTSTTAPAGPTGPAVTLPPGVALPDFAPAIPSIPPPPPIG